MAGQWLGEYRGESAMRSDGGEAAFVATREGKRQSDVQGNLGDTIGHHGPLKKRMK